MNDDDDGKSKLDDNQWRILKRECVELDCGGGDVAKWRSLG